jgi:hypothetical protein
VSRRASFELGGGLPEWAAILLLASTFVLEAWDVWREYRTPHDPAPITADECWAFCDGEQPKSWGAWQCTCSGGEE